MRNPWTLAMLALLGAVVTLAWWLPNRPRDAGPDLATDRLPSVSFAPFRPGQSPLTGRFPTAGEVEADLALLAPRVANLRTYAANEGDYDVAGIAGRHGLTVWQGIWLGSDRAANAAEIARGIALARAHPTTITRVVVGNEVLLRRDLPAAELIAALDEVRAAVPQPVTYADVWEFWEQFPEVAGHVDVVTIHLLPYWEDVPTGIEGAVAHVAATWRRIAARFPGRKVAIGETGWPSRGRARADAEPGVVAQATFVRRFLALATAEGFDANLIEAFDQGWKYASEGVVGANWGLLTEARAAKFPLRGRVAENPDWPLGALLSCLLMLALLAGAARPGATPPGLAVLAAALGTALAYAQQGTAPDLHDTASRVAAAGNLAGQAVLAALLMRRAAALLAGETMPRARTGAELTATLRRLLRGRAERPRGWAVFDDLSFLFVWAAAVLELLLVFDPRYRDFPIPAFAVPLVAVLARWVLGDLPRDGGGRAEAWAGGVLAAGAVAGAVREGALNGQSLAWSACALMLAAPALRRLRAS